MSETSLPSGLHQWGGPASPTDELAVAIGFADAHELVSESARIADALRSTLHVSPSDFGRALLATEIVFVSDQFGAGVEWETVTGLTDQESISRLRDLQRKLVGETRTPSRG